jgi:hypothetical protein
MGSPYASGSSSGGSAYASGTAASSSPYAGGTSSAPTKKKGGGVFGFLREAGHVVADKSGRAAHDIKAIPGGVVQLAVDEGRAIKKSVEHPWISTKGGFLHPQDPNSADVGTGVREDVMGQVEGAKQAIEHPLRDPFATLLTVGPGLHGAGRVVDEAAALGSAARGTGRVRLTERPRVLKSCEAQVPLHGSTNPAARAAQSIYDAFLQKGLDTKPEGRVAAHAQKRIGGSISETQRYRQHIREVPANEIDAATKKLGSRLAKPGSFSERKVQQAALRLARRTATAEEAANYIVQRA